MKQCYRCKVSKDRSMFKVARQNKDGLYSWCRKCVNEDQREKRNRNANQINEQRRQDARANRQKFLDWDRKAKARHKERMQSDPEYATRFRERHNLYLVEKRRTDPMFRVKYYIRNRLRKYLKGIRKSKKFNQYIGCTPEQLKEHLESLFSDGMTWENYGFNGWHIDHIVPLDTAQCEDDLYRLNHYTNLQPLWKIDNLRKGNKSHLPPPDEVSL